MPAKINFLVLTMIFPLSLNTISPVLFIIWELFLIILISFQPQ